MKNCQGPCLPHCTQNWKIIAIVFMCMLIISLVINVPYSSEINITKNEMLNSID
jgi:hypothetical protein